MQELRPVAGGWKGWLQLSPTKVMAHKSTVRTPITQSLFDFFSPVESSLLSEHFLGGALGVAHSPHQSQVEM